MTRTPQSMTETPKKPGGLAELSDCFRYDADDTAILDLRAIGMSPAKQSRTVVAALGYARCSKRRHERLAHDRC